MWWCDIYFPKIVIIFYDMACVWACVCRILGIKNIEEKKKEINLIQPHVLTLYE